jgi:hypothetical protein
MPCAVDRFKKHMEATTPLDACDNTNNKGIWVDTELFSPISKTAVGIEPVHVYGRMDRPDAVSPEADLINHRLSSAVRDDNQAICVSAKKYRLPEANRPVSSIACADDQRLFRNRTYGQGGYDMGVTEMGMDNVEVIITEPFTKTAAIRIVTQ